MGDTRNIGRRFDDLKSVEVQGKSGVVICLKNGARPGSSPHLILSRIF